MKRTAKAWVIVSPDESTDLARVSMTASTALRVAEDIRSRYPKDMREGIFIRATLTYTVPGRRRRNKL